jgi:hypothetical protein
MANLPMNQPTAVLIARVDDEEEDNVTGCHGITLLPPVCGFGLNFL